MIIALINWLVGLQPVGPPDYLEPWYVDQGSNAFAKLAIGEAYVVNGYHPWVDSFWILRTRCCCVGTERFSVAKFVYQARDMPSEAH